MQKLVDELAYVDKREYEVLFLAGATTAWSLAANARDHPRVREALQGAASERTRGPVRSSRTC